MINALEQEEIEEAQESAKEGFQVTDLNSANWCLRKIKAYKDKVKDIDNLAESEKERISAWHDKEIGSAQESIEFFEGLLGNYLQQQRQVDNKFRISTPYGKVSTRKLPDKWIYDDVAALKWVKQNVPDLVRTKEEINKVELKKKVKVSNGKAIDENGEIVPGINIIPQGEKIVVEVSE